jgi:hypothetical protein
MIAMRPDLRVAQMHHRAEKLSIVVFWMVAPDLTFYDVPAPVESYVFY